MEISSPFACVCGCWQIRLAQFVSANKAEQIFPSAFYYRKLHLPPRCGNLGILKRILCDNGLGKIVTEVVYHAHPLYTDERLEETLRSVLNQDLSIIERISNTKTPNMGADLMTNQQREQESFFKQLSQPEDMNI